MPSQHVVTPLLPAPPPIQIPDRTPTLLPAEATTPQGLDRTSPRAAPDTLALRAATECLLPSPKAPSSPRPAPRSRAELDQLIALTNRALELSDTAQGLHDLVGGILVGGFALIHVGAVVAKAYVWTWVTAAEDGANRGRARVCRSEGTTSNLRHFEFISGTLVGAGAALALCPVTAALVASKQGIDALHSDITYVLTRIPRGLYTYLQIKARPRSVDELKAALMRERDALILERAQPEVAASAVVEEE